MKIIFKTLLLVLLLPSPALAASGMPADSKIEFAIYRNGAEIGTHTLTFTNLSKGQTQVDIAINMLVKLGPVPVFRYEHTNREVWEGNKPVSVSTKTNDNGDKFEVSGVWRKGILQAISAGRNIQFSSDTLPSSYWNPRTLKAKLLLNTQTGEEKPIRVTQQGQVDVETASGVVQAKRYAVKSKQSFTIDYDIKTGQWVGLAFSVRGSDLTYRRTDAL